MSAVKAILENATGVGPKKTKSKFYKWLKAGSLTAPFVTITATLNYEHLSTLFNSARVASGIIVFCVLLSAFAPSFSELILEWLYPEDEDDSGAIT